MVKPAFCRDLMFPELASFNSPRFSIPRVSVKSDFCRQKYTVVTPRQVVGKTKLESNLAFSKPKESKREGINKFNVVALTKIEYNSLAAKKKVPAYMGVYMVEPNQFNKRNTTGLLKS